MAKGGHAVDDEHPVLGKRPINEVRLVIDELMALAEGAGTAAGVPRPFQDRFKGLGHDSWLGVAM